MTSRLWNILQSFTAIQQSHFKGIQILNHRRKKNYIKTGVHKPTMKGNIGKTLEKCFVQNPIKVNGWSLKLQARLSSLKFDTKQKKAHDKKGDHTIHIHSKLYNLSL